MEPEAYVLRCDVLSDYSRDPARLGHGGNGGAQALNLGALAGGRRIILLGYDMQYQGRRANWHDGHPIKAAPERRVTQWIPRFRAIAAELEKDGVDVINASERTALDCFRRQPIAELLPDPEASA